MSVNKLLHTISRNIAGNKPFGAGVRYPPLSHGGNNRAIIAGLIAITVPTLYNCYMRTETAYSTPLDELPPLPDLKHDTIARSKRFKELEGHGKQYLHPEHQFPELYKPSFGRVHARKRVDGPPDGRNHKDMTLRNEHM